MKLLLPPLALLLAGCVAPEPPPAPPRRASVPAAPLGGTLEAAPRPNRGVRAPEDEPILRVQGLKSPPKTAPPI